MKKLKKDHGAALSQAAKMPVTADRRFGFPQTLQVIVYFPQLKANTGHRKEFFGDEIIPKQ